MRWLKALMENEAVVAVTLVTALANLGMAFGLDLTTEQVAAVNAVIMGLGAWLARALVWSKTTHETEREKAWVSGFNTRSNTVEALKHGIERGGAR